MITIVTWGVGGGGRVVNTCGAQKKDGPNLSTSFLA